MAQPDPPRGAVAVRPRLAASWQRSEDYGVPVDAVEPVFTGSFDTGSLLYECGTEVLEGLQSTLANEPISLMIADRDGLVLTRLCNDAAIVRSLDRVHLAPGFSYAERNTGTNGVGLSLADRAPTLVRADEHYCTALRGYTCAAAPVLDPRTGDLAGTINLTTWSQSSSELLLALAQSAAGNTSSLMLARAAGRTVRAAPRGEVFHVWADRSPGDADACPSRAWRAALVEAQAAMAAGHLVALVGEPGAGKATLASLAHRSLTHRERVLNARVPDAAEVAAWLTLWTPALATEDTCVVLSGAEALPAWAASEVCQVLSAEGRADRLQPLALTARDYAAIPAPLSALVDTVVEVPPLRLRGEDILPLARHFVRRHVAFTPVAAQALAGYHWPGNVRQLRRVVRDAAARSDVVDARHLAPEVFSGSRHPLSRLETFERDEIIRCLTVPGATAGQAAAALGMSRATVYRKIAQYDIRLPGRAAH